MRIQHNIMAMNAYRNYTNNVTAMKKNLEKLSSGYKINRAGDDAAGLAISEKMRAQITGLQTAQKNAKDGISLVQTAEGALTEVHDMLNRMVELATQSANGTYDNTTDRYQLQKEVNQLLEEIDRIADSSNFNGINLLDGTLGLNTDAFTVGSTVAANDLVAGEKIGGAAVAVTTATAAANQLHTSDLQQLVTPKFSIDLADYTLTGKGTDPQSIKITVGDATVMATFAGLTSAASTKVYKASDIANAFVTAFNKGIENATDTNKAQGKVNGLAFKASVATDGHTINFEYAGVLNGAGTKVDDTAKLTATMATTFNALFGGGVTLGTATHMDGAATTGRINCDILNPKEAVAPGETARAGITFELKGSAIGDGNVITIDGKDFTIKMSDDTTGDNVIDLRNVATAATAAQLRELVLKLANETTDNFTIHTEDADNGKIHLEQTEDSYANGTGELYDYDRLSKLVEVKGPDTPAKNAGTELTVTDAKIKEGNVISVGTNKFVAGKDYTNAAELKAAIEAKGYTVDVATGTAAATATGATKLIIRAKDTTDGTTPVAPKILGKGLTLQIGDTSDDFNQLNVAVQDMHASSLGVGKLDISTEEAAQQAIKKIKDAINTVSDVRGSLGATQNRLDHTINNLSVMTENIQDAESTIRDTDVADEMMAYTKNNILIQSAQAMLAQANQVPQGVLQLLQ